MTTFNLESARDEKGFTLVELAVVMVIIGLLIGGILKGQEMIANQQVNSTVAQIKSIDAATSTFRDIYDALPGDMIGAIGRIPGCVAPCANGDGDTTLETDPTAAAPDTEAYNMYKHLAGADLLGGVNVTSADGLATSTMETKINGRYLIPGYTVGGAFGQNVNAKNGHYLLVGTALGGNDDALTPLEAARIDRKMDDNNAITGSVFTNAANACHAAGVYDEDNGAKLCDLLIRFNS